MINHPCSIGRTELATRYFPNIQPQNAWQKLRGLLAEDPDLRPLTELRRRTFLPIEVNKIYQSLGQPWAAYFSAFSPLWVSCQETPTFDSPNSHFHGRKPPVSFKVNFTTSKRVQCVNRFQQPPRYPRYYKLQITVLFSRPCTIFYAA